MLTTETTTGATGGAASMASMATAPTYPQCTEFRARTPGFQFRNPETGRVVRVLPGHVLWVTSTEVYQRKHGHVMLARQGQSMGSGWAFALDGIAGSFDLVTR